MVSTNKQVYSICVSDNDKKVGGVCVLHYFGHVHDIVNMEYAI